jgi:hypothetical protein
MVRMIVLPPQASRWIRSQENGRCIFLSAVAVAGPYLERSTTMLQAAAGAGRTVIDVDGDLEEQEAQRSAKQTARDQLLARVNDLRRASSSVGTRWLRWLRTQPCCAGACLCSAASGGRGYRGRMQGRGDSQHEGVARRS